jgi:hypothetical protein
MKNRLHLDREKEAWIFPLKNEGRVFKGDGYVGTCDCVCILPCRKDSKSQRIIPYGTKILALEYTSKEFFFYRNFSKEFQH